jgi:SAM-dependent methyltransferase
MNTQNILTDITALSRNRSRAREDGLFLHRTALDEVEDRLGMVNRTFKKPAIVTGFPLIWDGLRPDAVTVPDSDTLNLDQTAHDLVIHALGLHWANDPVGQIIQSRRALEPDGLFLSVSFGGQTLHELRACLAQAEAQVTGGLSPRVAPMAELRDIGGLLQRAGLALPVADSITLKAEYDDIWHLMRDLRAMGETNAMQSRLRIPTRRAVFQTAAKLYQDNFSTSQGRIIATFELLFLAGWAPAESQPKPLRPGSAQQRLADALATVEKPLSD